MPSSRMNGDVVGRDRTILVADRFDAQDLEALIPQIVNRARENVVSFALEFRSFGGRALFQREHGSVHAVRTRLAGKILRAKLDFRVGERRDLRLVVKPVRRRCQHK